MRNDPTARDSSPGTDTAPRGGPGLSVPPAALPPAALPPAAVSDVADPDAEAANVSERGRFPPHARWLLAFQAANAASFTLCLGAPMVLTARYLGANESAIGLLISLTPFLVVLQLFATNVAERWGYRRLMLTGWTLRAFALLVILPLPLLVGRVASARLVLVMFLAHFAFNFIRGCSSGAWLPWLSQLIPKTSRGVFLGNDSRALNLAALVALLASAWFLSESPEGWRYSVLYGASFLAAMVSVLFLRMVPHRMPADSESRSRRTLGERFAAMRRVWRGSGAFRRITRYVALYHFAHAAVGGFLILFLKEDLGWAEGTILALQAAAMVGIFLTAVWWGRISDSAGSRPLMRLALLGNVALLGFWSALAFDWSVIRAWLLARGWADVAARLPDAVHPDPGVVVIGLVFLLMGLCGAAHTISQTRLVLANCPEDEVTVGMAVYQVATSLALGLAPLVWGVVLQRLRATADFEAWGMLSPFAVFFLACFLLTLSANLLLSRVPEPKSIPATGLLAQLLWRWPARAITGIAGMVHDREDKK